jgi:vacuolar-type H+-ATPase subunit I/STV1
MILKLCVIGLFILLGILFLFGKGTFLIAGYNMLTKKEKERINTKVLTKFMGFFMFAVALIAGLSVLDELYPGNYFEFISSKLLTIVIILGIVYVLMSKRLRNNN